MSDLKLLVNSFSNKCSVMSKLFSKLLGFVSSVEENSDSDEDKSANNTSDDASNVARA